MINRFKIERNKLFIMFLVLDEITIVNYRHYIKTIISVSL